MASHSVGDTAKKRKTKTLNSHHCDDNNHKSMCHWFTHPRIFISPLQSCYWKAGAREYSSVLLQQQAERSGSNRNNYLVYTLFMGWTAWKVPKFGKRCWKIPRKAGGKKARHDHIDLHLGQKPQKVTVTVTVFWGKTGQQQGHRPFMALFT